MNFQCVPHLTILHYLNVMNAYVSVNLALLKSMGKYFNLSFSSHYFLRKANKMLQKIWNKKYPFESIELQFIESNEFRTNSILTPNLHCITVAQFDLLGIVHLSFKEGTIHK